MAATQKAQRGCHTEGTAWLPRRRHSVPATQKAQRGCNIEGTAWLLLRRHGSAWLPHVLCRQASQRSRLLACSLEPLGGPRVRARLYTHVLHGTTGLAASTRPLRRSALAGWLLRTASCVQPTTNRPHMVGKKRRFTHAVELLPTSIKEKWSPIGPIGTLWPPCASKVSCVPVCLCAVCLCAVSCELVCCQL